MNLLVTGGAGYIGSHFSKIAKKNGHNPVVLDDLSTGHKKFVKFGPFVEAVIHDKNAVIETIQKYKVEAVFHFAGKALVAESVEKPGLYLQINEEGTKNLLECMVETGVKKLIFSSSCSTYGVHKGSISEATLQKPTNPYGESKLNAEKHILDFQKKHGLEVAILRYFNVIGCDPEGEVWEDHDPETHLVPNMIRAFLEKKPIKIFGVNHQTQDGTCVRDYIDVNDLADVHLEVLKKLSKKPFISNIGLGKGLSVLDVVKEFGSVFGTIKTEKHEARPGDPSYLVTDAKFFKSWYKKPLKTMKQSLENLKNNL